MKKVHKIICITIMLSCLLIGCSLKNANEIYDKSEGSYCIEENEKEGSIKFDLDTKRFVLLMKKDFVIGVYGNFEIQKNKIIASADNGTEKYVFTIKNKKKISFVEDESIDNVLFFSDDMFLTHQEFKTEYSEEYGYPGRTTFEGWETLSVYEKIEICRVPNEILELMTEKELIESVFAFPFSVIYDEQNWEYEMKVLETTCDAFAELLNRESGFEAMKNYVVEEDQEMRSDLLDMMIRYVEKGSER